MFKNPLSSAAKKERRTAIMKALTDARRPLYASEIAEAGGYKPSLPFYMDLLYLEAAREIASATEHRNAERATLRRRYWMVKP